MTAPILVPDETKAILDERGGEWGIYLNLDFWSARRGDMQFIRFGEGCTHAKPPPCMHDGVWGGRVEVRAQRDLQGRPGVQTKKPYMD